MNATYDDAWHRKGSAEYLEQAILTGDNFDCPHPEKLIPGLEAKIPSRLGFFQYCDQDVLYLDTSKLCLDCYRLAAPDGFVAWSTFYHRPKAANPHVLNPRYHRGEPYQPTAWCVTQFPRQIQAGTAQLYEQFSRDDNGQCTGLDSRNFAKGSIGIPGFLAEECWKFLRALKQPFYIDMLHLDPPWNGELTGDAEIREGARVARANAAAYAGAAVVITDLPAGGVGPYTTAEERLATEGEYRLQEIGTWRDEGPVVKEIVPPPKYEEVYAWDYVKSSERAYEAVTVKQLRALQRIGRKIKKLKHKQSRMLAREYDLRRIKAERMATAELRVVNWGTKIMGTSEYATNLRAEIEVMDERLFKMWQTRWYAKYEQEELEEKEFEMAPYWACNHEVNPRYYGNLGEDYYLPGHFMYYPPLGLVNGVTEQAVGTYISPTTDEAQRREDEDKIDEWLRISRQDTMVRPPQPVFLPHGCEQSAPVEQPLVQLKLRKGAGNRPRSPELDRTRVLHIATQEPRADLPDPTRTKGEHSQDPPRDVHDSRLDIVPYVRQWGVDKYGALRYKLRDPPMEIEKLHRWLYTDCQETLHHDLTWVNAFSSLYEAMYLPSVRTDMLPPEVNTRILKQSESPDTAFYLRRLNHTDYLQAGTYILDQGKDLLRAAEPDPDLELNAGALHALFHTAVTSSTLYVKRALLDLSSEKTTTWERKVVVRRCTAEAEHSLPHVQSHQDALGIPEDEQLDHYQPPWSTDSTYEYESSESDHTHDIDLFW
ncbi:hypothetical protein LTR17_012869 [Elasticomyces elasticus]|nr:hypothetical protein LTR17_012869 [Elasticomyces elasticus]